MSSSAICWADIARVVADQPAVGQDQHPVGVRRRDRVVADHDDGLAVLADRRAQQPEHLARAAGVEVAGRLVGEHDGRARRQRPRDRDPLLLAAGQLAGPVADPVGQAEHLDEVVDPRALVGGEPAAGQLERQQHVLAHVEGRHQVEGLEDEADVRTAQDGPGRGRRCGAAAGRRRTPRPS